MILHMKVKRHVLPGDPVTQSFLAGTTLMRLDLGTFTRFGYTNTAKGNKTERLGDYSTLGFLGL
jgi:hypothetical protein